MSDDEIQFIHTLAEDYPEQFEELAAKKKWTTCNKNPERALKQQDLTVQYWNLINNLPKSTVKTIVTDDVLKMDQRTCDSILHAILKEKQQEDLRRRVRQHEQIVARNKTVFKHNKQLSNLESIGVKIRNRTHERNHSFAEPRTHN